MHRVSTIYTKSFLDTSKECIPNNTCLPFITVFYHELSTMNHELRNTLLLSLACLLTIFYHELSTMNHQPKIFCLINKVL